MKMREGIIRKSIALFLVLSILVMSLSACEKANNEIAADQDYNAETTIDTEAIAEIITNEIKEEVESQANETAKSTVPVEISTDWNDYVGDLDTFVYGLITAEYGLCYDVFNACIVLEDGRTVYGLGYSDYAGVFESDSDEVLFPAGFLALIGEPAIPAELIEKGVVVTNLDSEDNCEFIYSYESEPYLEHCVIWGQYLKYGINENGAITYETCEYVNGECDEELGALYSYDEQKFLYDPNVGEYHYISGDSLYASIDYSQLENDINRILDEQDANFAQFDVQSAVLIAQEAVNSFLLSMQQETFMGYDVKALIEAAEQIDPMECIQLTPDGMIIVDAHKPIEESPTALVKWITGISCGIVVVGCIAMDIFCPALVPLSGAIASSAVEVFMEVVVSNQTVSNINWAKVGVSAISGAMLAWCCPMLAAGAAGGAVKILGKTLSETALRAVGNLTGYAVLAISNAVVSGATGAAFTLIDGGSKAEAFDAFKMGALIGGALTIGVSALAEGAGAIVKAVNNSHPNNWLMKASEKASNYLNGYTNKEGVFVKGHQIHFSDDIEKVLIPKSVHQATEAALMEVRIELCGGDAVLADKITQLPSDKNKNFILKDADGNTIKKTDLMTNNGNGKLTLSDNCDPDVAKAWAEKGITEIDIVNGDPQFAPYSDYAFSPEAGITSNRDVNMVNFRKELANSWTENSDLIPPQVKAELEKRSIPLDNFSGDDLQDIFSTLQLTLHEGTDGTVYLLSRPVHQSVGHYGGVALAKALEKIRIASEWFSNLYITPAPSITGTLIAEGVS